MGHAGFTSGLGGLDWEEEERKEESEKEEGMVCHFESLGCENGEGELLKDNC